MRPLNCLFEKPEFSELEILIEEDNKKAGQTIYISGPYLMAKAPNKNKRIYDLDEMISEVKRYTEEFIKTGRAIGELGHPKDSVEVDLERACHTVVTLEQKGNLFYGKSKILSTPAGVITKQLLSDGVKLGISSRALGRLIPEGLNNKVQNLYLIALDLVHEPSVSKAMLESIMENRQFIITEGGKIVELACNSLECKLNSIPKKNVEDYLKESFASFIEELKKK